MRKNSFIMINAGLRRRHSTRKPLSTIEAEYHLSITEGVKKKKSSLD